MKPTTVWIATVLLAVGACGILDVAGIVDTSQTIAQWWPVAIVGWAVAAMLGERRVTVGVVVCAAIGLTLLADAQAWASGVLLWSLLAITIGLAILADAGLRHGHHNDNGPASAGKRAS
jgi:hypothetical protein